jgi:hypothetical protein
MSLDGSGHALFTYHRTAALATNNPTVLLNLQAVVPNGAASHYREKEYLDLSAIALAGGTTFAAARADGGVHVVAYLGDASGDGQFTSADAVLAGGVTQNVGLPNFRLVDPAVIADVNIDGNVSGSDATLINRAAAKQTVPQVPAPPAGVTVTFSGADPTLRVSTASAAAGGVAAVAVGLDDPQPAGSSGLTGAVLVLGYDPAALSVSAADVHLGGLASAAGWRLAARVDAAAGLLAVEVFGGAALQSTAPGDLVGIDFHVLAGASAGASAVNLRATGVVGGSALRTLLTDADGLLVLGPAPTDGWDAGVDGSVLIAAAPAPAPSAAAVAVAAPGVAALAVPVVDGVALAEAPAPAATFAAADGPEAPPALASAAAEGAGLAGVLPVADAPPAAPVDPAARPAPAGSAAGRAANVLAAPTSVVAAARTGLEWPALVPFLTGGGGAQQRLDRMFRELAEQDSPLSGRLVPDGVRDERLTEALSGVAVARDTDASADELLWDVSGGDLDLPEEPG